ncbi:uncharacterized protein PV09_02535 [Verruconis gallopava]|uniref:Uncharacterized protein n=1 Tax=Verruconis gallopava TaxID=253628 RepID=A0A0D2B6J3_9PEZI|nr:uncharacterized protein PV09_02535 [Verruconis gallopava]KIW06859.1 hypothetical protein PV09_02535 [Verruconis gallopava]
MSNGKEVERLSNDQPSSPHVIALPEGAGSSPTALSPTATLGHSSPELPTLPPLPELPPLGRYPAEAASTASASDTSYFTASWGSPYQHPPPRSIASNLDSVRERSPSASSEVDEDSPNPKFGLSHLVPSRLPPVNRLAPTRPSTPSPGSPPQSPTRFPYLASSAKSLRQFFTTPSRPAEGHERKGSNSGWNLRSGWWGQTESNKELELVSSPPALAVDSERNIDPFQLDGTADTLARTDRLRVKGHKSRDSNLTLTQDDFLPKFSVHERSKFNIQEAIDRSRMYASRYAVAEPQATAPPPPPKDTPKKNDNAKSEGMEEAKPDASVLPATEPAAPSTGDRISPSAPLQRTESSSSGRVKKTVKYRGKNVHINIPTRNVGVIPWTKEQVDARLQEFEKAGYDTRGFDKWNDVDSTVSLSRYQNREIHPDPAEDVDARRKKIFKVHVPNIALWDEYVAFLREEKLRMLGVSLGGSETLESPLSRQASTSQFSQGLPFSPPIPTSSAGSQRHGHRASVFQFPVSSQGHGPTRSIASPLGAFGHMHRQSMFSPPTLSSQSMTPPGLQNLSPQLIQALTTGSPGPEMHGRRGSVSPLLSQQTGQAFPFGQRNELLAQMQRQKEQQLAMHLQQQAAMQQMLNNTSSARPASTLQEVPEVDDEDEFGRPQLRSRQGEAPEIVNPKPSHRHNISVKLEEGINNSDYHLEKSIDREMDDGLETKDSAQSKSKQLPPRTTSLRGNNGVVKANGGVLTPSSDAKQNLPAPTIPEETQDKENDAPPFEKAGGAEAANPWANDPTFFSKPKPASSSRPAHLSHHSSKSSLSGLNVAAKEFSPTGFSFGQSGNPSANFNPGIFSASAFSFTPAKSTSKHVGGNTRKSVSPSPQQTLKSSFSSLSAAAPAFNPQAASFSPGNFGVFGNSTASFTPSKSEFSFTSNGPSFNPATPVFQISPSTGFSDDPSSADFKQSIFGKINVAGEGKKVKKSKAIPIIDPETLTPTRDLVVLGEDGRVAQSDERQKRAKTVDSDEEKEPLFAPMPTTLASNATSEEVNAVVAEEIKAIDAPTSAKPDELPADGESELPNEISFSSIVELPETELEIKASPASPASSEQEKTAGDDLVSSTKETKSGDTSRVFSNSSALSASAAPFEFKPNFEIDEGLKNRMVNHLHAVSKDKVKQSSIEATTPRSGSSLSRTAADEPPSNHREPFEDTRDRLPSSVRYFDDQDQPSFQEIDAVMRQLNEDGSDGGIEREEPSWPNSSSPRYDVSPLPSSPQPHAFQMPLRSDAPSPSPRRPMITKTLNVDSASVTQDPFSDGRAVPGYDSPVRRMNGSEDIPVSDWDDVISSGQEDEFRQKAEFFGPHVSNVIRNTMDHHFSALEKRFSALMDQQIANNRPQLRRTRSRVTVDSDADDEDEEVETDAYSRGFSPKRDRRMEKYRSMLQEVLSSQRPRTPQGLYHFEDLQKTISEIQEFIRQRPEPSAVTVPGIEDIKAIVEETVAHQNEALIKRREEAIKTEDEERFHEFSEKLKEAATRIAAEIEARSEAERREAETNRLLKLTEEELALVKEAAQEETAKLRALEEATEKARTADNDKAGAHADLSKKLMDLALENDNLKETLDEYRLSSEKWRRDLEQAQAEREKIHAAFGALKIQSEEALRIRDTMRIRIEKLQDDMNNAVGQVAAERAKWARSDAEHRTRYEILAARAEAEARTRERFERELERLETQERESYKLKAALEHEQKENVKLDKECERLASSLQELHSVKLELVQTQKENSRLEDLVEQLKAESLEHQKTADQYAREFREAREAARLEVDRTRSLMQIDIENANHQVNIIRSELEAENSRLRVDLDNARLEADTLRAKHELDLEQAEDAKRDALKQLQDAKDAVFEELRSTYEERLEELRKQHRRDLDHTIENKNQSEAFLKDTHSQVLQDLQDHHERAMEQVINEKDFTVSQLNDRLNLANSKIEHLQDKIVHLEEKLEMAKTAAHAAAQAAQSAISPVAAQTSAVASAPAQSRLPEKISPQALRESIAVLQEQLQERENRIENLEQELSEVDKEAPAKLKAKDTEIGWLRELIGVRVDDLTDLINVLGRPDFDREAVRNAAIRIRASIQMEQDAKERQINGTTSFPTLASIQSFASPKAAQLAAAIGNWRRGGGGIAPSGLAQSISSSSSSRTETPSKPASTAQSFLNGLMTPPASNLRKTPSPDPGLGSSRPRPLNTHTSEPRPLGSKGFEKRRMSRESEISAGPSTPPFLKAGDYDEDAEESTTGYYDDEESTVEGTPKAERMRSLEPFGLEIER